MHLESHAVLFPGKVDYKGTGFKSKLKKSAVMNSQASGNLVREGFLGGGQVCFRIL